MIHEREPEESEEFATPETEIPPQTGTPVSSEQVSAAGFPVFRVITRADVRRVCGQEAIDRLDALKAAQAQLE